MMKFKIIEEILDHHLSEEEDDLFPAAANILIKEEHAASLTGPTYRQRRLPDKTCEFCKYFKKIYNTYPVTVD